MSDPIEVLEAEVVEEEEEIRNLPAVRANEAIVARAEITVQEVVAQRDKIIEIMRAVMTEGVHYGTIPGVDKPSLFKPGAEAINVALRLAPHYEREKDWHMDGHLTVTTQCTLKHITSDLTIATGGGMCSTREEKYAYRKGSRKCPACGAEAVIKGKAEYGGGWLCWAKRDGCGAKFSDDDPSITGQEVGRIPNENIADSYNTVLKMADKRSLIAAVLNGTAASDVFTQDVEDAAGRSEDPSPPRTEVRVEGPAPLKPPKSWAQITEYVSVYDEYVYDTFNKFGDAARRRLFPGSTDTKSLSKEERAELFQVTSKAAMALRKEHRPEDFPLPNEGEIRKAWAVAMDGEELDIPHEEEEGDRD